MAEILIEEHEVSVSAAMFQAYDQLKSAREIAVAGVLAATEFDQYSALPYHVFTCKLQKNS